MMTEPLGDSTHYMRYLSGSRKSDLYRNYKSNRKQCAVNKTLSYTGSHIRLPAIPLASTTSKEKKVRFCVNVECHEYPA